MNWQMQATIEQNKQIGQKIHKNYFFVCEKFIFRKY